MDGTCANKYGSKKFKNPVMSRVLFQDSVYQEPYNVQNITEHQDI